MIKWFYTAIFFISCTCTAKGVNSYRYRNLYMIVMLKKYFNWEHKLDTCDLNPLYIIENINWTKDLWNIIFKHLLKFVVQKVDCHLNCFKYEI